MIESEFDPAKDAANLRKHGLSLGDAVDMGWDAAVIVPDARSDYGEPRFRAYAMMQDRLHMAVFTPRGDRIRIISLRRANRKETRRYGNAARS